jgi:hypothetical protein
LALVCRIVDALNALKAVYTQPPAACAGPTHSRGMASGAVAVETNRSALLRPHVYFPPLEPKDPPFTLLPEASTCTHPFPTVPHSPPLSLSLSLSLSLFVCACTTSLKQALSMLI